MCTFLFCPRPPPSIARQGDLTATERKRERERVGLLNLFAIDVVFFDVLSSNMCTGNLGLWLFHRTCVGLFIDGLQVTTIYPHCCGLIIVYCDLSFMTDDHHCLPGCLVGPWEQTKCFRLWPSKLCQLSLCKSRT